MGFFDFLKKKDALPPLPKIPDDLGGDFRQDSDPMQPAFQYPPTMDRMQQNEMQFPANTYHPNRQVERMYDPGQPDLISKNIEIVSYKIDALKAAIDSISQRLANLESMARNEQDKPKYKW
jgi:hypothetical protein